MGEEEAYCNLELEMIKEVRENEDVTLANETESRLTTACWT